MKYKNYIILIFILFLGGYFFASFCRFSGPIDDLEISEKKVSVSSRFSAKFISKFHEEMEVKDDLNYFIEKLQNSKGDDVYDELFDEIHSSSENYYSYYFKMNLLLKKWAQSAPRQALQKIISTGENHYWVSLVFETWASRDPEKASAFYNESQDDVIKKNPGVVAAICGQWTKYAPDKAWDWLLMQKDTILNQNFQKSKNAFIHSIAINHPDKIPQFLEKWDKQDLKDNAYILGEKWVGLDQEFNGFLEKFPENIQIKAKAGRIMGVAKGRLNEIQYEISQIENATQRTKIIKEMALPLLESGGLDSQDKVSWILDSIPEVELSPEVESNIRKWMLEDRANAKKWIDSLPNGSKKDRLEKFFTPEEGVYFF